MTSRRRIQAFGLVLIGLVRLIGADEPLFAPQDGVVLLNNGHAVQGQISREGNQIIVKLGQTGEIRISESAVQLVCQELHEAYRYKRKQIDELNPRQHIALAHWCLRYELFSRATAEVELARRLDPATTGIASLQRQIQLASRQRDSAGKPDAEAAQRSPDESLQWPLRDLPAAAVQRFTNVVQPLLVNRCATAGCHGPASESQFRLQRPLAHRTVARRTTLTNLQATLQYVDRAKPLSSPLLELPKSNHAQLGRPVFAEREKALYDQLEQWVRIVTSHQAVAPNTIESHSRLLQTPQIIAPREHVPGGLPTTAKAASDAAENSSTGNPQKIGSQLTSTSQSGAAAVDASSADRRFEPRDPFDPEIFNRRFFPNRARGGSPP